MKNNIIVLPLCVLLICITRQFSVLPWWSFVVPVLILGVVLSYKGWKIAAFPVGMLAGFLVWSGGDWYYDMIGHGLVFDKVALLLSVPKIILILAAGVVGGLLTGIALFTGQIVFATPPGTKLEN